MRTAEPDLHSSHKSVLQRLRLGAILWIIGPAQFLVSVTVTQLGWTTSYSLLSNTISDLGAATCGIWPASGTQMGPSATPHYVCSPSHLVFNASIIILGLMLPIGALIARQGFPTGRQTGGGLVMIALGGIGAIVVGLFPEDVNIIPHSIGALLQFIFTNVALLTLGYAMRVRRAWRAYEILSFACGLVGLLGLPLFLSGSWGPLGVGGSEWLIVAPVLLWAPIMGFHLLRSPPAPVGIVVGPKE